MKEEKKKMLAEKYAYFQMLLNNMTQQREKIEVNLQEIEATLEIVSRITKDEEIVFSLGSNVFGSGKLTSEKFLVNIGLNILIETNKEKTLEILKRNKEILENNLNEIDKIINQIITEQQKILNQIQNEK